MNLSRRGIAVSLSMLLITTTSGITGFQAQAQDATSTATNPATATTARVSHIHNGTCAAAGTVAWFLNDAVPPGAPETAMGTPIPVTSAGSARDVPTPLVTDVGPVVAQGITRVQVHLRDLEKAPFAIDLHAGLGGADPTILCGEVTGAIMDNSLTIPLRPVGDAGLTGVALLQDDGTGITTITVQVLMPPQGGGDPTPTGTGGEQPQTVASIDLIDIAFVPNSLTIAAGTDVVVTLTNTGVAPHNFSITDHKNDGVQNLGISVDLQPGQSTTVTINAPAGDYYFFCNVPGHEAAGMFGTLRVR